VKDGDYLTHRSFCGHVIEAAGMSCDVEFDDGQLRLFVRDALPKDFTGPRQVLVPISRRGKWEDLCVFSSDIEDEAADVLAEAEDVMRFHQIAHLAILECHPTNNTSYTIRRGKIDEEAGMITEASAWAKQVSAYKDDAGKAYPASTIRILYYDANGVITTDTLLQ